MEEQRIAELLRNAHYAAAVLSLVVAPVAMAVRKGGDAHRLWGRVFFWGLVAVTVTAIAISVFDLGAFKKFPFFRTMVAVLALHLAAAGRRSLRHKRLHAGQKPATEDLMLWSLAGVVHGGMLIWGSVNIFLKGRDPEKHLFLYFGLAGLLLLLANINRFNKRTHDKHEWLFGHIIGMVGAYTVTIAVFVLAHFRAKPDDWPTWTWPLLVGIPMILLWTRHYQKRFTRGRRAKDVLDVRIK